MERVAECIIENDSAGMRLDVFLRRRFSYRSRSEWQKSLDNGEITVNGRKAKASLALKPGMRIAYDPGEIEEPAIDPSFEVIEETPEYMAVSKSGDLPCHPAGIFFKHTLWYLLREKYGENIHIATRLDRETSGIVLIARNPETAKVFTLAHEHGKIEKVYNAAVYGKFTDEISAEGYLSADPDSPVNKKRRFTREKTPDSETASTMLRPLKYENGLSLVEARPVTGRLHQIRATLCSLGFPLAGDKLYGPDSALYLKFISDTLTDEDRRKLILPRQALHALSLKVTLRDGRVLAFSAPLPDDMKKLFTGI